MPFTIELAGSGWHATIFVSWGLLAVLALSVIGAVVATKLLVAKAR